MKEVDARGLSCPEPMMLANNAIMAGEFPVKILVSEPHQKMNVEKLVKESGKKATVIEKDLEFEIVIE